MSKQEFNVGLVVPKFLTHNICAALANSCLVKMATRHKCDEEHFGYHNHCDPHHHGHHHHRHQPEGKTTSALTTSLTPQRPNSTWNCHFISIQNHCHCQWMASLAGPGWARRGGCHRMLIWCVSILSINIQVFDLLHCRHISLNKSLDHKNLCCRF